MNSPSIYIPGYAGRLFINGQAFAFSQAGIKETVDKLVTTNSEGAGNLLTIGNPAPGGGVAPTGNTSPTINGLIPVPGFHTSISGNNIITFNATEVTWDLNNNPFNLPFGPGAFPFLTGNYCSIQFYVTKLGGFNIWIPVFHILESDITADAVNLEPFTFNGVSTGPFYHLTS
jgi:hypothetical protein